MRVSKLYAGRAAALFLLGSFLLLASACATGPAMPFDALLTPTAPAEADVGSESSEVAAGTEPTATPAPPEPTTPPAPTATPTPKPVDLRPQAETTYLRVMNASVSSVVREQPWYATLSPLTMELVAAVQRSEKAAQPRGQALSVADMLKFASEQPWYADGLDEREVKGLAAVFDAYGTSLSRDYPLPIGKELSSTIRWSLFDPMKLAESGEIVVLSSSPDEASGRLLLQTASTYMQPVEELVGKFPYRFLHFTVTDELPEEILGVSINEFILVRDDSIEPYVVTHEITHSTLYGNFPEWFEEGMAHFIEYDLTSSLAAGVAEIKDELDYYEMDLRVDIRPGAATWADDAVERYRGFLFLERVHAIQGRDEFRAMIRQLRTRNFGDQDLLKALTQTGTAEKQVQLRQLVCSSFIGARNLSCAP